MHDNTDRHGNTQIQTQVNINSQQQCVNTHTQAHTVNGTGTLMGGAFIVLLCQQKLLLHWSVCSADTPVNLKPSPENWRLFMLIFLYQWVSAQLLCLLDLGRIQTESTTAVKRQVFPFILVGVVCSGCCGPLWCPLKQQRPGAERLSQIQLLEKPSLDVTLQAPIRKSDRPNLHS